MLSTRFLNRFLSFSLIVLSLAHSSESSEKSSVAPPARLSSSTSASPQGFDSNLKFKRNSTFTPYDGNIFATVYQPKLNLSVPVYPTPYTVAPNPRHYSTLIAFGDSYTDDGHSRIEAYSTSYCVGVGYVDPNGGRCTNVAGAEGRVQVEYMVQLNASTPLSIGSGIQLLNYAYAGAQIDNAFLLNPSSNTPSTSSQVIMFVEEFSLGKLVINSLTSRTLIYFNAGINPIAFIWEATVVRGNNETFAQNVQSAQDQITAQLIALEEQIRDLNFVVPGSIQYADYVIVNVPPPELLQFITDYTTDPAFLTVLTELGKSFNDGLAKFFHQFRKEVTTPGRAFYFDLAELWREFHAKPEEYQLDPDHLFPGCYDSVNNTLCSDGGKSWLTVEGLHPSSRVHGIIAQKISALVMDAQGYLD